MSTATILQDLINRGLTQLYVGKNGKTKPGGVSNKVACGILIDKAFVATAEISNDSEVYLDGKDLLQASLDCKAIVGRYLIQNHSAGNAMSKYGMVLVPEGVVKLNLDVASEYIVRMT